MATKVTIDNLDKEIKKIFDEYSGSVMSNLDQITRQTTKKGVQALKSESKSTFGTVKKRKKKYASTWTSKFETGRLSRQGIIYNTQAGLPHLLEHGHAKVNGGRVQGRAHIQPVEQKLVTEYEREVKARL